MKSNVLILLILSSIFTSFGQSEAERFSTSTGALLQKTFIEIGSIRGVQIKLIDYRSLTSPASVRSLKFEHETGDKYTKSTKVALLDQEEISDLLKALQMIITTTTTIPENYTELSYKSNGGFEVGCFLNDQNWLPYLKLDQANGKSYIFLENGDLDALILLLNKALTQSDN